MNILGAYLIDVVLNSWTNNWGRLIILGAYLIDVVLNVIMSHW
ncbi:MAG: hypothetical protein ACRCW6_01025 [Mycoplasmoidaceae bacterium]